MMHTLYLIAASGNHLLDLRAVRGALRTLGLDGQDASIAAADRLLDCFARDGYALLGSSPDRDVLAGVQEALAQQGCKAVIDLDPERAARRTERLRDRAAGKTPEEVFAERAPGEPQEEAIEERFIFSTQAYETAMAMIVIANGNPLNAAAHCHVLARTTEDEGLYMEVQAALVQTFPHLDEPLRISGLRLEP